MNTKFKVGDRVKLKLESVNRFPQGIRIGIVKGEEDGEFIMVSYEGCESPFPYLPKEIESAIKVGEQLLFDFMKG